jgi:asparagine synthetase B (glutamine-hydrolysing)
MPVFWVRAAGTLILCSHVSTLLALPSVSAHLNEEAASRYLFWNRISDTPETLVESIYQVCADERIRLDSGGATCVHRWAPRIATVSDDDQDTTEEFRRRLESAITAATRDSRRPAIALSGGLDSSALAALLVRQRASGSVATHSVTYGQFASERARITRFIQEVPVRSTVVAPEPEEFAADLETLVRVADLPFTHPGYYTHFRAYKSAGSAKADVVLIGEGSDGSFGARARFGSTLIRDLALNEGILYAFREARNLARNNGWNYVLGERLLQLFPKRLQARVIWQAWGCDVPPAWRSRVDGFAPSTRRGSLTRVLARELSSLFAPEMWQYRRMGSHFGLDVRYPFLDARVTEWTHSPGSGPDEQGEAGIYVPLLHVGVGPASELLQECAPACVPA